ncbi:unnamed protein product [Larinioides sclopetarius]|uniref:RING-type domain-containing protein n=1 Tax=Larinioides sclopetarius TaxID=280406 RepID=A0AAV2AWC2_9ARAC
MKKLHVLELLKNPVSTGCGHFFCRFCITETLQSNYRTPCPLCKKSFTRRGIQDAHQRRSILVAAKKLADVCGTFADVKFFNKECSQREVVDDVIMPTLTSVENQSNATEKTTRTSVGRKRKSNEKAEDAVVLETDGTLPVLEKIGSNTTDGEPLKNAQGGFSDDEAIPTSNKRCRQSVEDSDSDGLPDLKILFHNSNVPKVSEEHSSDVKIPCIVAPKTLDFETNKNLNSKKDVNSVSKNVSSATKTNVTDSVSKPRKKNELPMKTQESNCLKIVRKRRFKAQNLKEKNKSNPLRNKTNELNIDDTTNNNINIALNVIEEVDKNINSLALKKIDEAKGNKEIIKENYQTKDVDLFSSPIKEVSNKRDLKSVRSPQKSTKTPKSGKIEPTSSSSEEEERLVAKINDAENFKLTISRNTIPSTVLVSNNKECYSLNETNIPELKEKEKPIENVKKAVQSDDIADTAISVQTVASPETSKAELATRSPGWSKVKQVGKDFRVKKFSKLSVEKNSSHSCPTEMANAEPTKSNTSSSESLGTPKFKKLPHCNVSRDSEKFSKKSETSRISKNSSLGNEVVTEKQSNNCELMSDNEKRIERTEVSTELDKYDHNSLVQKDDEMNCQTEKNLNSAGDEISVALEESGEVNKNKKDNITSVLSNDCSFVERHHLTSDPPVNNHILPDFQLSSISDGRNGTYKGIQNNLFNTGMEYEGEDVCMNDEGNMEVDTFSANEEHLKQPENETSCIGVFEKEIPIQTLPVAGLCNEVNDSREININSNFQDQYNEFEPRYDGSVLPSEESFLKPDMLPSAGIMKENKLLSKISKISKCEITAKSIFDKGENVFYTEHSQQTSQRLLEFCNDGQRKQNSFSESVTALDVPFCNTHGIVAKRNWYNQVEKFKPLKFGLGPQNTEKTKVLKRTCLTLDEIQEAFTNSSLSGTSEMICSLPFSSEFRLHICVSEETLNISVLKVVDFEFDAPNVMQVRKTVVEKDIQTSNNNSRVNSPVEILPSSNVASDSSQPDQGLCDSSSKMKNNIFPYLSKYFPDSESTDQPCLDEKKSLLNDSEIIPFQGSKQSLNKNEDIVPFNLEEEAESDFHRNGISLQMSNNAFSNEASNKDENNKTVANEDHEEICVAMEGKNDTNIPKLDDSSESLPPTMPYLGSKQNSMEGIKNNTHLMKDIIEPIGKVGENIASLSDKIVESTDNELEERLENSNTSDKADKFQKPEEDALLSDDEENINFDELNSYQKTLPNNMEINDSDGLSSDPAMAFAAELVAPLKNIAAKMNSAGNNNNLRKQEKSSAEDSNSREKRPLQEFEDLVFNLSKNSASDTSIHKSSRLSLKSKRAAKKFKRIKKFDSDSDSEHSSKDELCAPKDSSPKDKMEDVQVASSKVKGNELISESLQEQSTLNSFLSEDITSKDPNQLVKEVEVLDKEIYSVVEQLKQCGREDVLKRVLSKLHTECEKESPVSEHSDKDQCMSDDSEDSTDIFSQSVPPTPPDNTSFKNDSVFKSSHYKHN